MNDADYQGLVKAAFIKFVALHEERTNLDAEIAKLRQFIFAAGNMLPDKEREAVIAEMALIKEAGQIRDASLSEATRTVFNMVVKWLTVREVVIGLSPPDLISQTTQQIRWRPCLQH